MKKTHLAIEVCGGEGPILNVEARVRTIVLEK
jgi:hypothetical protein